ncbi:uncharacterized protein LOC143919790 isoform X2 [Arctopsyche grandis]|uniref:uncharacterized protein LOC143919790 isoform X2 n=1 Tax=Arctopsyche grandis TaxID=121162 RepID=UPI00406D7310
MSFTTRLILSTRLFHTSCIPDYNVNRLARNMNKLIRGSNTIKKKWYDNNMGYREPFPTIKNIANPSGQHGKMANRRTTVLSKLFMRHITDQMSTGYIASKLYGRNIEISRLRVTNDFQTVNIYWLAKGSPDDKETHQVLNEISGLLRHELSQLNLMGRIPKLIFVKDRTHSKNVEVEFVLAQADFGEDFVPTDASHALKSEFILNTKLDHRLKENIESIEDEEFIDEKLIPLISENIFGLDRGKITRRIVASMNKAKDAFSNIQESKQDLEHHSNTSKNSFNNAEGVIPLNEKTDFQEFLRNRKIEQRKALKSVYDGMKNVDISVV